MKKYRIRIGLDVDDTLYECNSYAVDIIDQGKKNRLVGYKDGHVYDVDIDEAFAMEKSIDDYQYTVANILGTRCEYKDI